MENRIIFHCDCNNFYASCECLERPELRDIPMAVAGNPEYRTGIVVAKNEIAKRAGVKTTDTVWAAKKKCPGIVFVPPRHRYYEKISAQVNALYREYTEYVEPASIDESYLDLTGTINYFGKGPVEIANEIRRRVREEIGVTISVGVSYNKTFAKMGSDYKKPDATTLITPENYREILWPLPVSDLIYAGRATVEILKKHCIFTIGELAGADRQTLHDLLGKGGDQLWLSANGLDDSPVRMFGQHEEIKSVSRGMTFRRDLVTEAEVRAGISALADEVAMNLRRNGLTGSVVQIQIKTPQLTSISRQTTLDRHTCLQHDIMTEAMALARKHWNIGPGAPIRAITVGVTHLLSRDELNQQLSLFDLGLDAREAARNQKRDKMEKLEAAVNLLREKHGDNAISIGLHQNEEIGIGRGK